MKRKERDDDTSDSEDDSYTNNNTNNTIKNDTTAKNFKQNKVIRLNDRSSSSSSNNNNNNNNNNKQSSKLNDTLFVPTANDIFESAVMKRLKDTNTINKSKKFKYDAKQIQKVCTELKDQYNINLKFGRTWISSFQRRHNLVKDTTTITSKTTKTTKTIINPVKKNTAVNDKDDKETSSSNNNDDGDDNINDGDNNNDDDNNDNNINDGDDNNDDDNNNNNNNDDDDNNNDDNNKSIPSDIHLNQPFEAAVLNKLKDIVPAHRSNSKFLYNYSQIKNVCLELKNQYDMKGCIFSSTWISSFQTRHNLIQIQHEIIPAIRNKCRYCHCLAKSLMKKGLKVLKTTLKLHESKCIKNPSYRFIENNNNNDDDNDNNNSINLSNISNHHPSLLELSLLRNHSRSKKLENITNDYRNKNIIMTKETLIEDWNIISDKTKSNIIMKVNNGNHIRKKKLMKLYNNRHNKRNIPKYEYEIQVPFNNKSNILKNDYIPKNDDECNIIDELKGRNYINNTIRKFCSIKNNSENSNIKKQKNIVTKMLNSMTMIPINDQFIAKNFKKQNVIEANQNISNIKDKLLNFLNM